jgi:hypothetical protein
MIDLEQTLRDQKDLDALFVPPDLSTSVEKYSRNDAYGFAAILKAYAGYDPALPVEAVIPHGVYVDAERIAEEELEAAVPAVLNYPAFRSAAWERVSDKTIVPSASPFLYGLSMFRQAFPESQSGTGTIFFLAHSIDTVHLTVGRGSLVRELRALDERFQPVTVCIHMTDHAKGLHQPFVDAGFNVVSAGNVWDPEFLNRWLHLLFSHSFAASNDIGGSAYYSVAAGMPFILVGDTPDIVIDPTTRFITENMGMFYRPPTSTQVLETLANIRAVFAEDGDAELDKEGLAAYLLGAENFKSPAEMRGVLEYVAGLAADGQSDN